MYFARQKTLPRQGREKGIIYSWYHLVSINITRILILKLRVKGRTHQSRLTGDIQRICSEEDLQPG